jgi:hypothetical protein
MKLTELMNNPLTKVLDTLEVSKLNPITDDKGEVIKIIIEYTPKKED